MVGSEATLDLSLLRSLAKQHNDEGYAQFVCKFPFSFYVERVKRLGFVGKEQVLDVGCGLGQWTAALSLLNKKVVALEQNPSRLAIAEALIKKAALTNVEFALGEALSLLDRDEDVFDAIFCYGVFMFLDRQKAIKEFRRVLKPGGDLYICTNARGWWTRLWLQHWFGDKHVRRAAYRAMVDGSGVPNSTSRRDVTRLLKAEEWEALEIGYEGTLSRSSEDRVPQPIYRGTFLGSDAVIEFLAKKRSLPSGQIGQAAETPRQDAGETVRRVVVQTIAKQTYEYLTPLHELPQPHPAHDLVNNCFPHVVEEARVLSRSLDRIEQLQWIYRTITEGSQSPVEQVRACTTFAQLHFFHHFAGQPMQADNVSVLDPVAALRLRFGRCGNVGRFLVDMFECNGVPARLLTAGCHTSAEVWCQGRWILADASLFPPGVSPHDQDGGPISIEEAAESPFLLDRCPSYINYHHEYIETFLRAYPETAPALAGYLRAPLLPSSAFFGREYFAGRTPGLIERLRKLGSPQSWNADENFGWLRGYDRQTLQGPALVSRQRPGQVTALSETDDHLRWERPFQADYTVGLSYLLVCSHRSRGWTYTELPVGCHFAVSGQWVRAEEPCLAKEAVAGLGRHVTIYTQVTGWENDRLFYLPSNEFELMGT